MVLLPYVDRHFWVLHEGHWLGPASTREDLKISQILTLCKTFFFSEIFKPYWSTAFPEKIALWIKRNGPFIPEEFAFQIGHFGYF